MQRYARGLVRAALDCEVAYESERAEAVTGTVRALALNKFGVKLSAADVLERAWPCVLAERTAKGSFRTFIVGNVHAPISGGSSSLALSPLQLHGARVQIGTNTRDTLTCSYIAADDSIVTFDGRPTVGWAVRDAGMRGVVFADFVRGLPDKPLPKQRRAAPRWT